MKKILLALLMATGFGVAQADVTGNAGVASDFRFRGVSQSQNSVAEAVGFDYTNASGFYAGNLNSSVSSQLYTHGAGVKSDVYAGFKKNITEDLKFDIGSYNHFFARATNGTSDDFNTNEGYAGLAYGPMSVKYNRSLSNYFGAANSKGSHYYEADLNYPVTGSKVSVLAHAGRLDVRNSTADYNNYNVGLGYNLVGWNLTAKYYTNSGMTAATKTANTVDGQNLYKNTAVVAVSKAF